MKKQSTIKDIAAALGISKSTVSRALSDDLHVTPETRARVIQAAKEMNYHRNCIHQIEWIVIVVDSSIQNRQQNH